MSETKPKLTEIRRRVLSEVDDAGQSFRVARRLQIAQTSVQSALQWARRSGLCSFNVRLTITPAGRAALASATEEKTNG